MRGAETAKRQRNTTCAAREREKEGNKRRKRETVFAIASYYYHNHSSFIIYHHHLLLHHHHSRVGVRCATNAGSFFGIRSCCSLSAHWRVSPIAFSSIPYPPTRPSIIPQLSCRRREEFQAIRLSFFFTIQTTLKIINPLNTYLHLVFLFCFSFPFPRALVTESTTHNIHTSLHGP